VASIDDLEAIRAVDDACFDEFWRHEGQDLKRGLTRGRCVLGAESGQVVGYTWCTIERGVGTLGRIAVVPDARGHGVGRALLDEALSHMLRDGAGAVSLCTQEHNTASRALYASAGLRELPGRLVLMMQDA
jgi:ribosomal protein S18 acetylase RimI-like enzyme